MDQNTVAKYRWDDIEKEIVSDTFARRLIWGERAMLAQVFLRKGTIVPKHSHVHEQFSCIARGVLRFWLGDEDRLLDVGPGEILRVPSQVAHRAEALEDVEGIDVFSPPREDWLQKADDYLRKK